MSSDLSPARSIAQAPFTRSSLSPWRNLCFLCAVLAAIFFVPLWGLLRYSVEPGSLYSHIILIPFVSLYLGWINRKSLPVPARGPFAAVGLFSGLGILLILLYFVLSRAGVEFSRDDFLSITIGSFYCFVIAAAIFCLGNTFCRKVFFPLAFLVFIIPFPASVTTALENASKYASAGTYEFLMKLCGATYYREGFTFALPGLNIQVAQECSGIRSSLVLFITSLIAGYLFLSKRRNRALISLLVLPLGVLRNAFRILVLSLLTVHWDPRVIDSPLHHQGGPLFFALSLVPFLLALYLLSRSEKRVARPC